MTYTTNSTIEVHKVIPAGETVTATALNTHAQVTKSGVSTTYNTGLVVVAATEFVPGSIKITVPIDLGASTIDLIEASDDDLDVDGITTAKIARAVIQRVENAAEVITN